MEVVSTTSTINPLNMYNYLNSFVLNPAVFIILLIIVLYFVFVSYVGSNNSNLASGDGSSLNYGTNVISVIVIVIVFALIVINLFQYFFSINVTAYIQDLFTSEPKIDIVVDQTTYQDHPQPSLVPEIKFKKQVFNVPGNYYSYDDAKAVCKAYGADLATYDQIEKAYDNGAEWCNYGWSSNQLALFPTQKKTYEKLQKAKGHENDCGRPGVNGGFIANPNIKFGVNCYGNKPKMTSEEEDLMKTISPYPETKKDLEFQKRVDYWKNKADEILISPFNYNSWYSF